tara:strand:- start:343 stop:558 length:216 start_codon:yes stop_codon:yes gene_type:complete
MSNKIMNKKEVAEYLKMSIPSIDRFMKSEGLPYSKVGKCVRYMEDSINEWLVKKNPLIKVGQALGKVIEKW